MIYESVTTTSYVWAYPDIIIASLVVISLLMVFSMLLPIWATCLYLVTGGTGYFVWLSLAVDVSPLNPFTIGYFFVSSILAGVIFYECYPSGFKLSKGGER